MLFVLPTKLVQRQLDAFGFAGVDITGLLSFLITAQQRYMDVLKWYQWTHRLKNIIATIPKSRFKTWEAAEAVVQRCDGEQGFWTVRMPIPPRQNLIGSLCYMIYDGRVRGYFDIVDLSTANNFPWHQERKHEGHVLVCANWHPLGNGPEVNGFQGWRYTALQL